VTSSRPTLLVISQVYLPDPASVGQHIADVAAAMVRRGYRVVVLTSARGYDDPSVRYPQREIREGVEIIRLGAASFGKRSILMRLAGGFSFLAQTVIRSFGISHVDVILVSTSPPLASLAALAISLVRAAPIKYWIMDLNPDQAVAMKVVAPDSLAARAFNWLNRRVLSRAQAVVVLDRFMAERVARKFDVASKMHVIAPWAHEERLVDVPHDDNPFRRKHGLQGKLVVMYSGNHSPANPLTTVLRAAERLQDDQRILFAFIGGGSGKKEVDAMKSTNILSLPYQPLEELRYSLAAADVHLVALGDEMVGIVHPCKVYGAMAVARPVVLFGPAECHISDILKRGDAGWKVRHGDVEGAVQLFQSLASVSASELRSHGTRAREIVTEEYGKEMLCGQLCDVIENGVTKCAA
jgi:glycosyltransferase involved in cell wall biosynthesis